MTDRLSIYNGALLVLKQRPLEDLDEELSYRDDLDTVWDGGGVRTCLSEGLWNFATRSVQFDYSPSITPSFGFQYAFDKPSDFLRTVGFSENGDFSEPYLNYLDEGVYWWANIQSIYVRYVSDDLDYGLDFARWPALFTRYVEHYFAFRICGRVTGADPEKIEAATDRALKKAKGVDAANEATVFPPRGSWVRARGRGLQGRAERGV